jgi:DNA modification methylase
MNMNGNKQTIHINDPRSKSTQTLEELEKIEKESEKQKLPDQKTVFRADSIKNRAGKRGVHNLPDRLNPPLGFDPDKAFDNVYPFIKLPFLHPNTPEDNISFGYPEEDTNRIYFGDNLHVMRSLKSNSIDLIYIDPPFFSGRNYNQIWGDDNEVRTFYDIWEDGLPSYLVWFNSRLWEMRRILKNTGNIYIHCDSHASHYIKCEMDKIFGYENFINEIIWYKNSGGIGRKSYTKRHEVILLYSKTNDFYYNGKEIGDLRDQEEGTFGGYFGVDDSGRKYREVRKAGRIYKYYMDEPRNPEDVWEVPQIPERNKTERIGYPTQKPEALLERIIKASSKEGDIVADFFMGGGTTLAVAQKLDRRFIGCDISRVAASVTINRIINNGEILSGRKVNINKDETKGVQGLLIEHKIPNIQIYYTGVYPIEKFSSLSQEQFEDFILSCYGARRFTGEGKITGVMNSQTNVFVGSSDINKSVNELELKEFIIDSLNLRYQDNSRMKLKVLAWTFPPSLQRYTKTLTNYFYKKSIAVDIELIPINSQLFRKRVLDHYQDTNQSEFLLVFVTSPSIQEIRFKKVSDLTYEFEAVGARSNNLDGYLINCQWDFDFHDGLFSEPEYSLMRETAKKGKHAGKYVAVFKSQKKFEKPGQYVIGCRVQDNMGSETIKSITVEIS